MITVMITVMMPMGKIGYICTCKQNKNKQTFFNEKEPKRCMMYGYYCAISLFRNV